MRENYNLIYVFGERSLLPFSGQYFSVFSVFGYFRLFWVFEMDFHCCADRFGTASCVCERHDGFVFIASCAPASWAAFISPLASILFVAEGSCDASGAADADAGGDGDGEAGGSAGRTASVDSITQPKSQSHWFHRNPKRNKKRRVSWVSRSSEYPWSCKSLE